MPHAAKNPTLARFERESRQWLPTRGELSRRVLDLQTPPHPVRHRRHNRRALKQSLSLTGVTREQWFPVGHRMGYPEWLGHVTGPKRVPNGTKPCQQALLIVIERKVDVPDFPARLDLFVVPMNAR